MTTQDPRKSTSTRVAWRAYVELEAEDGSIERQTFIPAHTVIGRSPGLPISIDHDTVSRRHAEVFCDPFGRWWIRDLGSTNGTSVNGERVVERVLQPGDHLAVGDVRLRFHLGLHPESSREKDPALPRKPRLPEDDSVESHSSGQSWVKSLSQIDAPQISAAHLSMIMALSRRLLSLDDAADRLASLCELAVSTPFHGVLAMGLRVVPGEQPEVLSGPHRPPHVPQDEPPYVSRGVLRQVMETGEPALASNLPEGGASLELTISADVVPLAAVACPLGRNGDAVDVLYVTLPPHFGRAEWLALLSLASEAYQQADIAWSARRHALEHAAIERELETARQIQRALIPKNLDHEGLDVAVGFEPCKWVGGDYVGAVTAIDGRVLFCVADVCGKGLQPALVTFSLHAMVRAMFDSGRSVKDIVGRLNDHLCEYMPEDSFVTMVCVSIEPATGAIECVNAGHPPAFVFGPDGRSRLLQSEVNPALGIASCEFEPETGFMAPGEVVLLYTDGLTELRNPARVMLGEEALARSFGEIYQRDPSRSVNAVADDLTAMLDAYREVELSEDDRAFLLARRS